MAHVIHWFRRDLRVRDNTGLIAAAREAGAGGSVTGLFVIDTRWWESRAGKLGPFQARFWLESLVELRETMRRLHMALVVRTAKDPVAEVIRLARSIKADSVTFNKEYEPEQAAMDLRLEREAQRHQLRMRAFKDAVFLEEEELLSGARKPYTVFTPYKRAYMRRLAEIGVEPGSLPRRVVRPHRTEPGEIPTLESLGFKDVRLDVMPGERAAVRQLKAFVRRGLFSYASTRDWPALSLAEGGGTSRLSAALNTGTLSIRQTLAAILGAKARTESAKASRESFLGELIWREFYRMILFHHPHTAREAFSRRYREISWENDPWKFAAWTGGRTGFPIVDAAMRQLLATGFMHNRLRMIAAMFLTKDLDCHWALGERFFMKSLVDYDQASNVGGWQWSASTGTDAAPYFRVMNPVLQSKRWDPDGTFIRHFMPELADVPVKYIHAPWEMPLELQQKARCVIGRDYPKPVVDHEVAKKKAIAKFRK